MREIKFRIWDKTQKRMIQEPQVSFPDHHGFFWRGPSDRQMRSDMEGELIQYTGLKDKNGKEIYEGDIVEYLDNTSQGLIKKTVVIEDIRHLPDFTCSKWEEIIGNMYENPGLLEKQA